MIDQSTVQKVALLARLQLTPEEEVRYTEQLAGIMTYIDQLSALDTTGVKPTTHALETSNITRPDTLQPWVDHEAILTQAPQREDSFFRVPRITG